MDHFLEHELPRRAFLKMGALAAGTTLALSSLVQAQPFVLKNPGLPSPFLPLQATDPTDSRNLLTPKDYSHLSGQLDGISDSQLRAHLKLYEHYVNKVNLLHQLTGTAEAETSPFTHASHREMHLEQNEAYQSVILHELYFGNLGQASGPSSAFRALAARSFGTWESYCNHLLALGMAMRGWALTVVDMRSGRLCNIGLDGHQLGSSLFLHPILALDVYEHAYRMDFGSGREKYLEAMMRNVRWSAVDKRLAFAMGIFKAGLAATD